MAWQRMDVAKAYRLWADHSLTVPQIAEKLGVTIGYLKRYAAEHHMPKREPRRPEACEAEPLDDEPAGDSLALSPWVEARVAELREKKLHQLRAESVSVTQSRVSRYRYGRA